MSRSPALLLSLGLLLAAPVAAQKSSADLALQKGVYDDEVFVGEEATFFIAVTNGGPDAATGVVVADVLPAALVHVTARPTRGDYDPTTGAWSVGDLAWGETETLELTVTVASEEPVQNCASVLDSDQSDANVANDSDCAYVYVRPKREKMVPLAFHLPDASSTSSR